MKSHLRHKSVLVHRTHGRNNRAPLPAGNHPHIPLHRLKDQLLAPSRLTLSIPPTPSSLRTLLQTHSLRGDCWCPPMKNRLAGEPRASKDPTRRKESTVRIAVQAGSIHSHQTPIPWREIKVREREIGTPDASEADLRTAIGKGTGWRWRSGSGLIASPSRFRGRSGLFASTKEMF